VDTTEFRKYAHELVDWMADYMDNVDRLPVRSSVAPGDILNRLPAAPPEHAEPFPKLMEDFQSVILPGMTHWQHPSFFAYFPANSSPPSVLAEMLTTTMGAQCMSWATSPAATELEERVMKWLVQMLGLPAGWEGTIQDTASTATLTSLLTARESRNQFSINRRGFIGTDRLTAYCSTEAHSSVEKAVRIAGLGSEHLRKIAVDSDYAMDPGALERAILRDLDEGYHPLWVVAALGTTGSVAVDPLEAISEICKRYGIWLHVDAAYAGTALVLPEYRELLRGIESADSFVFNPHKWMFTNFDCSAYFVKDWKSLVHTFEILPEYLKTREPEPVRNYRDWGIQLGRRFRALKLWFVIRSYGVEGIRSAVRAHIDLARSVSRVIEAEPDFELLAPVRFNLVCFRYRPEGVLGEELNRMNTNLMEHVNASGKLYLSHTILTGRITLRLVVGNTRVEQRHVDDAWRVIRDTARSLSRNA
jgi:aromatic-L-amino-acid decarboxylase